MSFVERRKQERPPFAISMDKTRDSARWQELTKKKWAEEDKRKKEKK
jgi:hypothetical protein